MSNYVLSCCTPVDLKEQHLLDRDIHFISFHFLVDGETHEDDLWKSMSYQELYRRMEAGAEVKTSQVNAAEFEAYFEGFLKEGKDILHVSLSSGISGVVNSAEVARDALREKYPERKICVVDSLCASSGYGLLMDKLADLRDEGMELDALYAWALENRLRVHHWFLSTDLTYFIKGGRISKAAGFFGGILNICPLMHVDNAGKLVPRHKIRTKGRVLRAIVDKMAGNAENGLEYADKCYISESDCYEDARFVADQVEQRFPKLKGKVLINDIGCTIGCHTGPGTVALFFWGGDREKDYKKD